LDLRTSFFGVDFWFRIRPSAGSFHFSAGGFIHPGLRSGVGFPLASKARPGYISVKSALGLPLPKPSPEATAPPPFVRFSFSRAVVLRRSGFGRGEVALGLRSPATKLSCAIFFTLRRRVLVFPRNSHRPGFLSCGSPELLAMGRFSLHA
jgi:hypothetical protein